LYVTKLKDGMTSESMIFITKFRENRSAGSEVERGDIEIAW
jgi:hypothetical protein